MQIHLESFSALNALIGTLMAIVGGIVVLAHIRKSVRSEWANTANDWKGASEASDKQLAVVAKQVDQLQREIFELTVSVERLEKDNRRLGHRNRDLQDEVDRLTRRCRQLERSMANSGITVPTESDEDD